MTVLVTVLVGVVVVVVVLDTVDVVLVTVVVVHASLSTYVTYPAPGTVSSRMLPSPADEA